MVNKAVCYKAVYCLLKIKCHAHATSFELKAKVKAKANNYSYYGKTVTSSRCDTFLCV